jgi:cytidylate kinase
MIITIDGPVGTGKSTIAKLLAAKLGFIHFDTGAMYRSVTYGVIKHKIDPDDEEHMRNLLKDFDFDIKIANGANRYFFESEDISEKIRGEAVTSLVSKVSAIGMVREKLVELQRKLGKGKDAVFEGRDMGSFVFPKAELKIFLIASSEIRAQRRFDELKQKFPQDSANLTFAEVLESVVARDEYDSTREISPLIQAQDAHIIDTSDLSIEEVLETIISIKAEYANG